MHTFKRTPQIRTVIRTTDDLITQRRFLEKDLRSTSRYWAWLDVVEELASRAVYDEVGKPKYQTCTTANS